MLSLNFQNAIVQDFWQDFIQLRLTTFKNEFIQTWTVVEDLRLRVKKLIFLDEVKRVSFV